MKKKTNTNTYLINNHMF